MISTGEQQPVRPSVSLSRSVCLVCLFFVAWVLGCKRASESPDSTNRRATLSTAAERGDLSQVRKLLREGGTVNERDSNGMTPLHFAAQCKNVSVVRALLEAGADVNAVRAGHVTPLMLSVDMAFGQPDIALALIDAGADVNAADENGDTALIIATTETSDQVFRALLDRKANPNARGLDGRTALHYAAMNAFTDRVRLLLDYGADPAIRDSSGNVPYDEATTTNPDREVQARFKAMRNLLSNWPQKGPRSKERLVGSPPSQP